MNDLPSWRLKVVRAEDHLAYLNRRVRLFEKRQVHRFETESNIDRTEHVVRYYGRPPVPLEWAVVLGEMMFDLRSALDHLAHALVIAGGGTPTGRTEFPIFRKADDSAVARKLRGASGKVLALIESFQPYVTRPGVTPERNPLWVVHELNRLDKHRQLHVVRGFAGQAQFDVPAELVGSTIRMYYQPLYDGTPVMTIRTGEPHDSVNMQPKVTTEIQVTETETTPFVPFPTGLRPLIDAVSHVLDRLEPSARLQ